MPGSACRLVIAALAVVVSCASPAYALTPLPRPQASPDIAPGEAAPFVGAWSVTLPTMEVGTPDTALATCALPVRIHEADPNHIFYLGPRETEADAAIELTAASDGTDWHPIAGGPRFFALWVDTDRFYLYDAMVEGEPDGGMPYVYIRCP